MNAAQIEKGHIEMHGGFEMGQALAKTEAQARKASQMRSHGQIRSFDVASRNTCGMRVACDGSRDRANDAGEYQSGLSPSLLP